LSLLSLLLLLLLVPLVLELGRSLVDLLGSAPRKRSLVHGEGATQRKAAQSLFILESLLFSRCVASAPAPAPAPAFAAVHAAALA
jgi:hypothetical protein